MKHIALLLMTLAVLAGGLVWLLLPEPSSPTAEEPSGSSPTARTRSSGSEVDQALRSLEASPYAPDEDDSALDVPQDIPRPRVRVVSSEGRPLPGVDVRWHATTLPDASRGFRMRQVLHVVPPDPPTHRSRSGTDGLAPTPELGPGIWLVVAGDAEAQGLARFVVLSPDDERFEDRVARLEEQDEPWTLELVPRPFRDLRVAVHDELGRPVEGAVVAVQDPRLSQQGHPFSLSSVKTGVFVGRTGFGGDLHWRLRSTGEDQLVRAETLRLSVLRLGEEPFAEDVPWPARHFAHELRVPRLRSRMVVPRTAEGMPPGEACRLFLTGAHDPNQPVAEPRHWITSSASWGDFLAGDDNWRCTLPPKGRMLGVFARDRTFGWRLEGDDRVPTFGRRTLTDGGGGTLELPSCERLAHVAVRFVSEEGDPLSFGHVRARSPQFVAAGRGFSSLPPEGVYTVRPGVAGEAGVFAERGRVHSGSEEPSARFSWPALEPGATHEVGDIVVEAAPVLLRGMVVDPDGNPVEGVRVDLTPVRERYAMMTRGLQPGESDADGKFMIRGVVPGRSPLVLRAKGKGHGSVDVPWDGSDSVSITVRPFAKLEVPVNMPSGLTGDTKLHLLATDGGQSRTLFRPRGESFVASEVHPGTYTVVLLVRKEVVHRREGIVLPEGEMTVVEGFDGLALPDRFGTGRVTVLGANGHPLTDATVTPGPRGSFRRLELRFAGRVYTDPVGEAEVTFRRGSDDSLRVEPPLRRGYRPTPTDPGLMPREVLAEDFPLTVRLRPFPVHELRLLGDLPEMFPARWRVRLSKRRTREEMAAVDARRQAEHTARLNSPDPLFTDPPRPAKRDEYATTIQLLREDGGGFGTRFTGVEPGRYVLTMHAPRAAKARGLPEEVELAVIELGEEPREIELTPDEAVLETLRTWYR